MTPAAPPRPSTTAARATRGFTLLELVFAFAILSLAMVGLMESQTKSMDKGVKSLELRDLRVMADTVFRRIVYETTEWDDGHRGDAAEMYADFAQIPAGPLRERWKQYRLELRKKKGLVAGTDPSGSLGALFEDTGTGSRSTPSTSSTPSGTSGGSTSGSGSETSDATVTGEPAYLIELDVYFLDREEPELTLRSIVPLSKDERDQLENK